MSQYATELCLLLVDDTYGGLTSQIFTFLMRYGRSDLRTITHYTELSLRQVKHGIAVLVQQHLALWFTDPQTEVTFYEASWTSAYALIRSGKLIRAVNERYDEASSSFLTRLLLSGHVRMGDLEMAYGISRDHVNGNSIQANGSLTNGHTKSTAEETKLTAEDLHSMVYNLFQNQLLTTVNKSHFRSEADNRTIAERVVSKRERYSGIKLKAADKVVFQKDVEDLLRDWQYGSSDDRKAIDTRTLGHGRSKKRPLDGDTSDDEYASKKRRQLDSVQKVNGHHEPSRPTFKGQIDSEIILRVNNEKLGVIVRNEKFTQLAEQSIGKASSMVYATLLKILENRYASCKERTSHSQLMEVESNDTEQTVFTHDILDHYTAEFDLLAASIAKGPSRKRYASRDPKLENKKEDEAVGEDEEEIEANGANPTSSLSAADRRGKLELIRQHLFLLSEAPYHFVVHHPRAPNSPEAWSVPYSALVRHMQQTELEKTMRARYGTLALRIARLLMEKGKLDEKSISGFCLMNQKTIRGTLTQMHAAGHLELQEVPRDANRNPARTLFLWYFDHERGRLKVLEETYKAMARCMQRIEVERETFQSLIDKASRTDVRGQENELLSKHERNELTKWRKIEEQLLAEISRLDDVVFVLRDF